MTAKPWDLFKHFDPCTANAVRVVSFSGFVLALQLPFPCTQDDNAVWRRIGVILSNLSLASSICTNKGICCLGVHLTLANVSGNLTASRELPRQRRRCSRGQVDPLVMHSHACILVGNQNIFFVLLGFYLFVAYLLIILPKAYQPL